MFMVQLFFGGSNSKRCVGSVVGAKNGRSRSAAISGRSLSYPQFKTGMAFSGLQNASSAFVDGVSTLMMN